MKKFLLLTIFVFLFSAMMFAADKNILLKVPGITWPGTAYRVSSTLKSLDGVEVVNTSVPQKEAYIKYDDSKVSLQQILIALEKAGYKAHVINNKKWNLI